MRNVLMEHVITQYLTTPALRKELRDRPKPPTIVVLNKFILNEIRAGNVQFPQGSGVPSDHFIYSILNKIVEKLTYASIKIKAEYYLFVTKTYPKNTLEVKNKLAKHKKFRLWNYKSKIALAVCRIKDPGQFFDTENLNNVRFGDNGGRSLQPTRIFMMPKYEKILKRAIQDGKFWRTNRVFAVENQPGRGVFTQRDFETGEVVCHYPGDLISKHEAEERKKRGQTSAYQFMLGAQYKFSVWDAINETTEIGCLINHSSICPNLVPRVSNVNGRPIIFFIAKNVIKKKEELLYDYGNRLSSLKSFACPSV